MKKFLTITFTVIAAFILVSCSGKNLDDLIDVPDTDDTADSSVTPDQNDTDNGSDTNADTTDDTDTSDTEPTEPTTDPTNEPVEPTDEPTTDPTDEPTTEPTDGPVEPTDNNDSDYPENDSEQDNDAEPTDDNEPENDSEPTDDSEPDNDTEPTDDKEPDNDTEPTDDNEPGDYDNEIDDSDADNPETPERCTEITLTNTELDYVDHHSSLSYRYDLFKMTYTPNTGSATTDNLYLRLFGSEYNYPGNHELAGTNWKNDDGYSSGVFLYVYEDYDSYYGTHGNTYFQKAGTVNVISAEINSGSMYILSAKLNGVVLEEVTINSIGESAPVEKGSCLKIKDDPTVEYHGYYY